MLFATTPLSLAPARSKKLKRAGAEISIAPLQAMEKRFKEEDSLVVPPTWVTTGCPQDAAAVVDSHVVRSGGRF